MSVAKNRKWLLLNKDSSSASDYMVLGKELRAVPPSGVSTRKCSSHSLSVVVWFPIRITAQLIQFCVCAPTPGLLLFWVLNIITIYWGTSPETQTCQATALIVLISVWLFKKPRAISYLSHFSLLWALLFVHLYKRHSPNIALARLEIVAVTLSWLLSAGIIRYVLLYMEVFCS